TVSQVAPPAQQAAPGAQPLPTPPPPVGTTPPQILATEAASGRRGAAWRLLHWIMEDDPRAILAVTGLDDDRLAGYILEFIALGTWAGKTFVVPVPLRTPLARTHLRSLFLPGSGMNRQRAWRVLLKALHDSRPALRENAVHILGIIGDRSAVPPLVEALKDPILAVRIQAAKALGHIGDPAAIPALITTLHSADEPLASQITSALVHIGPPVIPALLAESASNSAWMRWHTIRVLGEMYDYRALPALVNALRDSDHSVVWLAAKGLTHFGKWCIEPVLRLLVATDTSPWLAEAASYVLHDVYLHDPKLKPYLAPVVESMHGVAYKIGTPTAARKALSQLASAGLITVPS
ncbi:MAG: HEAT repeat domain-containing protein, partial [Ktedonobacteraceae bacterium]|nr:HEAT repeat domain-containing protein [Ktedonobacteraceae bacterium]